MKVFRLISFAFVLFSVNLQAAPSYTGKVIHVSDGDTIKILVNNQQLKIRLAEIDTPEKAQPYGNKAKKALGNLVIGKVVTVKEQTKDRYKRIVGRVYLDNLDVNAWMVENGHAWVYRQYSKDKQLLTLEAQAKRNKKGLWASDYNVPPWEWRRAQREGKPIQGKRSDENYRCGSKRYCKEMTSCDEAMFYLKRCGAHKLDGDGDGVPCEALCK